LRAAIFQQFNMRFCVTFGDDRDMKLMCYGSRKGRRCSEEHEPLASALPRISTWLGKAATSGLASGTSPLDRRDQTAT
jgi:hypothetical protein